MLSLRELASLGDVFFVSFVVAAISAWPIYKLLLAWKSRQTVSQYAPEGHQAKQGTPTMGGLIILAGAFAGVAFYGLSASQTYLIGPSLVLIGGFGLIGFVDDFVVPRLWANKRGLGWKQKIVMQVAVALLAAWLLAGRHGDALQLATCVFIILFFANAYNFSDGLDGLAGSLLLTLGIGIAAVTVHGQLSLSLEPLVVLASLMAATIPFLFLNAPPAKVFMGDVGSLPIGACLGLLFVVLTSTDADQEKVMTIWPAVILSLIMVAELVPVPLQILSVKLRKKRLFPYTPIHHAFEKAGWPETKVVWMFALAQLTLSGLALYVYARTTHPVSFGRLQ
jgi:phospho-N-acetylmuramoyl-pentapeptide-transferase